MRSNLLFEAHGGNNRVWIVRLKGLLGLWINVFQDRVMLISPGVTYGTHSSRKKTGKGCVKL